MLPLQKSNSGVIDIVSDEDSAAAAHFSVKDLEGRWHDSDESSKHRRDGAGDDSKKRSRFDANTLQVLALLIVKIRGLTKGISITCCLFGPIYKKLN